MNPKDQQAYDENRRVLDAYSVAESEEAFYKLFTCDVERTPLPSVPKMSGVAPSIAQSKNDHPPSSSAAVRLVEPHDELECIELEDSPAPSQLRDANPNVKFDNFVDEDAAMPFPLGSQRVTRFLQDDRFEDAVEPFSVDPDFDYDVPVHKLSQKLALFTQS